MPKLELLQWEHGNNDRALKFRSINNAGVHINGVNVKCFDNLQKGRRHKGVRHHNLEGDMILYLVAHLIKFQKIVLSFSFVVFLA